MDSHPIWRFRNDRSRRKRLSGARSLSGICGFHDRILRGPKVRGETCILENDFYKSRVATLARPSSRGDRLRCVAPRRIGNKCVRAACRLGKAPHSVLVLRLSSGGFMAFAAKNVASLEKGSRRELTLWDKRSLRKIAGHERGRASKIDETGGLMEDRALTKRELRPFGIEVTASAPVQVESIRTQQLKDWIAAHRFALLRGFAPLSTDSLMSLAGTLGQPLEWEFGAINELVAKTDAKNYIYTTAAVPFHWDGAFVGKIPHYILFSCEVAPTSNSGGE